MRDKTEVEELLNESFPDGADGPSKWPGMTYEQGVDAALRWVLEFTDENPVAD